MINAFLPELIVAVFALLALVGDMAIAKKKQLLVFGFAGVCAAAALLLYQASAPMLGGMFVVDGVSQFFKGLVLAAMAIVFLMSYGYEALEESKAGAYTALLLFATVGMMLIVSANDLLMLLVALELIGIPSFILTGFLFQDARSSEGAIKYFLIGGFSTAITIYGMSLLYGLTGTTNMSEMAQAPVESGPLFVIAVLMVVAGLVFEISLVPFHMWVPESYEGAPTPVTAYLSVAPKAATMAALLRVFVTVFPLGQWDLQFVFAVLSAVTMCVGNLAAIFQDNVKRMLGYSSIAQMGYVMMGVVVSGSLGQESVLMYVLVYTFMNLGAFTLVVALSNALKSDHIDSYAGLSQRSLILPLLLVIFLLSLAGIPPLSGFVGKFTLFAAVVEAKLIWLAVVGVLNSVVSVYYYMRIAQRMYFQPPQTLEPVKLAPALSGALAVTAGLTFWIGIYPGPFLELVRASAQFWH